MDRDKFNTVVSTERERCDDKFSRTLTGLSRERTKRGGINSVETTRLTRTETRHDFLAHGDLLEEEGRDSGRDKEETVFGFHSKLLFEERSNIHHARVKLKL